MKYILLSFLIMGFASAHEMQHGFIISNDETSFSHLVATGHHSHQVSMSGELIITDPEERLQFTKLQELKKGYFLFQAQKLNLPSIHAGQTLEGHIIQSEVGEYTPSNTVIKQAKIKIKAIQINLINPFFLQE